MHDPAFPVFCGLGIVLSTLNLRSHWKAGNVGTLCFLLWVTLGCLILLVNSVLWAEHTRDIAPVWCDISIKIIGGLSVGIPASSLCIQRNLYHIATSRGKECSRASKGRSITADLIICIGFPTTTMALSYVVQPNRYNIIEEVGCWPTLYVTYVSIPMALMWPPLIGFVSCVYAARTITAFYKSRRQFSAILSESSNTLNMSRYFRLMGLSMTDILVGTPLSIYSAMESIARYKHYPWVSWADTHYNFQYIYQITLEQQQSTPNWRATRNAIDLGRWVLPGCAFMFFMFFGLSSEARAGYKNTLRRMLSICPNRVSSYFDSWLIPNTDTKKKAPEGVNTPCEV